MLVPAPHFLTDHLTMSVPALHYLTDHSTMSDFSGPSFFNRSFGNVGSSPSFLTARLFDNVGSSPSLPSARVSWSFVANQLLL
jgi:hypothetical protein